MTSARKILQDILTDETPRRIRNAVTGNSTAPRGGGENRTTTVLKARVRPEVKERAQSIADSFGVNVSELLTALVNGTEPQPREPDAVSSGLLYAMAGNHVLRALATVEKRLADGIASDEAQGFLDELKAIRRAIVEGQLAARPAYEAEMDSRRRHVASNDDWTGE